MAALKLSRSSPPFPAPYRGRGNRGKDNWIPVSGSFGNRGKALKALQHKESFPEILKINSLLPGEIFPKNFPFYSFGMVDFSGVFRETNNHLTEKQK
jgi:hypothetical protein